MKMEMEIKMEFEMIFFGGVEPFKKRDILAWIFAGVITILVSINFFNPCITISYAI